MRSTCAHVVTLDGFATYCTYLSCQLCAASLGLGALTAVWLVRGLALSCDLSPRVVLITPHTQQEPPSAPLPPRPLFRQQYCINIAVTTLALLYCAAPLQWDPRHESRHEGTWSTRAQSPRETARENEIGILPAEYRMECHSSRHQLVCRASECCTRCNICAMRDGGPPATKIQVKNRAAKSQEPRPHPP